VVPTISGGVPPITIEWIAPSGQVFNQPSIDVIPQGVEIYCAVVNDGCNEPDTLCTLVSTPPAIPATFSMDSNTGCEPYTVLMLSDYIQVQNVESMVWHFGDGEEANVLSSANHVYMHEGHVYMHEGVYYPWLEITDDYGCVYRDTADNPVLVWPTPVPEFSYSPLEPLIPYTTVEFINESSGGLTYEWDFGFIGQTEVFDTTVVFPLESGKYPVTLKTTNQYGCADSLTKLIDIKDDLVVFIPNTFTPNGDGINDVWGIEGSGYRDDGYILRIYNRWGDAVFEAFDDKTKWVGDTNLGEYYFVPDGVYNYSLEVVDKYNDVKYKYNDVKYLYKGSVIVLR